MKTGMVVSCPNCGAGNMVAMEYREADGLNSIIAMIVPDVKQYTFCGEVTCDNCGETINAVLTVGTGNKKVIKI